MRSLNLFDLSLNCAVPIIRGNAKYLECNVWKRAIPTWLWKHDAQPFRELQTQNINRGHILLCFSGFHFVLNHFLENVNINRFVPVTSESVTIYDQNVTKPVLLIKLRAVLIWIPNINHKQRSHSVIFFWNSFRSEPFPRKRKHKQVCTSHIWRCDHLWHLWPKSDQTRFAEKTKKKTEQQIRSQIQICDSLWPSQMSQIGPNSVWLVQTRLRLRLEIRIRTGLKWKWRNKFGWSCPHLQAAQRFYSQSQSSHGCSGMLVAWLQDWSCACQSHGVDYGRWHSQAGWHWNLYLPYLFLWWSCHWCFICVWVQG